MQLSNKNKTILSQLVRFSWKSNSAGLYCMDCDHVDSRKKAVEFAKDKNAVIRILMRAGLVENEDYDFCIASREIEGDLLRLDIRYVRILDNDLNQYLMNCLSSPAKRRSRT